MKKSISFFGTYDPLYSRNRLTRKTFERLEWEVIECNDRSSGLGHYFNLVRKFIKYCRKTDLIFIGVLGHYDIPLGWLLARLFGKKLIFDAFYSLYDTYIEDRKSATPRSYQALRFYFYDWFSIRLADKIILDTQENIKYFIEHYKARKEKFHELPVTADPDIFKFNPPQKHKTFTVGFYGSFLPLHGVDLIVDAIYLLKEKPIRVYLLGSGPELPVIKRKVNKLYLNKTIIFEKSLPYEKLPIFFKKIDLFLTGPFGKTNKAARVLPAKAVESLSVGIPTLIAKTPATSRLLKNTNNNIVWLNEINSRGLAKVIADFYVEKFLKKRHYPQENYFESNSLSFKNFTAKLNRIIRDES